MWKSSAINGNKSNVKQPQHWILLGVVKYSVLVVVGNVVLLVLRKLNIVCHTEEECSWNPLSSKGIFHVSPQKMHFS
ncbi:hypothetical protein T11_4997 [Trichinella zimbabwensis]|uniref:Uncharacterized protein n=1 Tax=Trichinella zimbabwensis TaxID=268475 RepID=A0A0V1HCJ4_9BILA|nr:hypothetical protein T11_4997 [Trichinella zimbabwensis]